MKGKYALMRILGFIAMVLLPHIVAHGEEDLRVYQHGIDVVEQPNGDILLFWSSAGNPPVDDWIHDVYVSKIDRKNPRVVPQLLIHNDEAQEPVSVARNNTGTILVTFEDGADARNEIAQRYAVYDANLHVLKPYPQTILDGGHSGHVASVGERFVVFYSEGWVDGGGVDNLGSGDDVYAVVFDGNGSIERTVQVAVGDTRDWWPLVAGSPTNACLVWQRYVEGETRADMMVSLLDPRTGLFTSPKVLAHGVTYYTYNVTYLPEINRFLAVATANGQGLAYLLDNAGAVVATLRGVPPIVREGHIVVRDDGENRVTVAYPRRGGGVALLQVTPNEVKAVGVLDDTYVWQYMGTTGVFLDDATLFIASLSTKGVVTRTYKVESLPNIHPVQDAIVAPAGVREATSTQPSVSTLTSKSFAKTPVGDEPLSLVADTRNTRPAYCASVLTRPFANFFDYFTPMYRQFLPSAHRLLVSTCVR